MKLHVVSRFITTVVLLFTLVLAMGGNDVLARTDFDTPVTKKVMVLDFNPIIENQGGMRVREIGGWYSPLALEEEYISEVGQLSGGYLNYQIVNRIDNVDVWLEKSDGFVYNDESYMLAASSDAAAHRPDIIDYNKLLDRYGICDLVNRGEIDELWLWGGPWMGFYEAVMAGPGAFGTNGPPIANTSCQRQVHIMGFSYQVPVAHMLEDLMHRTEGTMDHVFGSGPRGGAIGSDLWSKFVAYEDKAPGQAGCGWAHFGPNSTRDYEWDNAREVSSDCDDWNNFPNFTGERVLMSCTAWECTHLGFMRWILGHLPKYSGVSGDGWNNWWKYIADPILPGDADGDGVVGVVGDADYQVWNSHYNQRVAGATNGDFDNSGLVDGVDYVIWLNERTP